MAWTDKEKAAFKLVADELQKMMKTHGRELSELTHILDECVTGHERKTILLCASRLVAETISSAPRELREALIASSVLTIKAVLNANDK